MPNFFDNLGAAARRTADKVNTQVSIAAQEQKAREAYQTLGKICYQMTKAGKAPGGEAFDGAMARVEEALNRIRELKARASVDPTADDSDFVDVP